MQHIRGPRSAIAEQPMMGRSVGLRMIGPDQLCPQAPLVWQVLLPCSPHPPLVRSTSFLLHNKTADLAARRYRPLATLLTDAFASDAYMCPSDSVRGQSKPRACCAQDSALPTTARHVEVASHSSTSHKRGLSWVPALPADLPLCTGSPSFHILTADGGLHGRAWNGSDRGARA